MRPVIVRVVGALRPARPAAPLEMPRAHVGPVADTKEQRARRPVGVFVHLAGRMHDEGAGLDVDSLARRAHDAAAAKAEIDFGRVGVTVIGADLAGLPAGDGEVSVFDAAEDFLDMLCGIELGLVGELEDLHGALSPSYSWMPLGCDGKWRVARMRQAPRESERTIVLGPCLSLIFSFTFRDHACSLSMILSENRFPLFGIMLCLQR
jgi:hypothetical protein